MSNTYAILRKEEQSVSLSYKLKDDRIQAMSERYQEVKAKYGKTIQKRIIKRNEQLRQDTAVRIKGIGRIIQGGSANVDSLKHWTKMQVHAVIQCPNTHQWQLIALDNNNGYNILFQSSDRIKVITEYQKHVEKFLYSSTHTSG